MNFVLTAITVISPTWALVMHDVIQGRATEPGGTFQAFYWNHSKGRGIWKWVNSLDAYQQHFAPLAGKSMKLGEVGVQSGGSINMWQSVLGEKCHVYGIDINPGCKKFADDKTTIHIGDQGDVNMWTDFFAKVTSNLDILIDDGGHQPAQMGITLHFVFPHINPGGYVAIEDIHGAHYLQSFFFPAAQSITAWHSQKSVASVHIYPFLLLVKKAEENGEVAPPQAAATVSDFPALWAALGPNAGKTVAVQNPSWGSFLAEPALKTIFEQFNPLHDYSTVETPAGCATTPAPVCAVAVQNSPAQASITQVDIYPTQFVVHVAATPPYIQAVRMGTDWLPYG